MAFFHRYSDEVPFTNLFRLLDAFDSYSSQTQPQSRRGGFRSTFNPKFDVKETETAYELYGEFPGFGRDDITIDFPESQTLIVSGRVERKYSSGTPPAGLVEDTQKSGAITEGGEEPSHKATVSDEATEAAKEKGEPAEPAEPEKTSGERFWHQERSVGQFHRTFTFPTPIDEAGATAKLNEGILHLTVPKASKREGRRITIE